MTGEQGEVEVAVLVAQGKTNRAIADELVVAEVLWAQAALLRPKSALTCFSNRKCLGPDFGVKPRLTCALQAAPS